jgi:NhaP-type Na+/H+ or K+/H+ antiporter
VAFIACFAGGLLFGLLEGERGRETLGGAASTGEVFALLTWVVFGGPVLGRLISEVTWSIAVYAVLSLTAIRIVPVLLALAGTGLGIGRKLFVGWFGPRGLATIVFAVIVFDTGLPRPTHARRHGRVHGSVERRRARRHGQSVGSAVGTRRATDRAHIGSSQARCAGQARR